LSSAARCDIVVELGAANHPRFVGAAYSAPDGAETHSPAVNYKDAAPAGATPSRVHTAGCQHEKSQTSPGTRGSQSLVTSTPTTPAEHRAAIATAAKEWNELREHWLDPPEWTRTRILEFPASVDGPWARSVECGGNLDEMNGVVAAVAGVLKDSAKDDDHNPVWSPIIAHKDFERLEAEGVARGYAVRLRDRQ
jgi:hypothetical protein